MHSSDDLKRKREHADEIKESEKNVCNRSIAETEKEMKLQKHEHKKKRKKEKKHHKEDKISKSKSNQITGKIDQSNYGKYGIIKEENYFHKQREFEMYMDEVKHIPSTSAMSKRDIANYFKSFMEDYNTATMPDEKYYNLERWEMLEYNHDKNKQQRDEERDQQTYSILSKMTDEDAVRLSRKREKYLKEEEEFKQLKESMVGNKSVQDDMKRQAELTTQLQLAFKRGDEATVKRLERQLAPSENKITVKHPWA